MIKLEYRPITVDKFDLVKNKHDLITPKMGLEDDEWVEDFVWLVEDEELELSIQEHSVNFINENKFAFQAESTIDSQIFFVRWSNVNNWSVIWVEYSILNYIGYDQG